MLTPRQREIAELVARGMTNKAIARETGLALQTVKNHISSAAERIPADSYPPAVNIRVRLAVFFVTYQDDAA